MHKYSTKRNLYGPEIMLSFVEEFSRTNIQPWSIENCIIYSFIMNDANANEMNQINYRDFDEAM